MIIHNPILTGSFTVNGTDVASITSSAASITAINSYTASQNILNGTYATTGSNTFAGIQTVNSNLIVTGSITAQTLVVQTITSSVDFVTGSTRFGSSLSTSTHQFTGSVSVTGSLSLNNIAIPTSASLASTYLPLAGGTLTGALTGTSATFSGNVGIGIASSTFALDTLLTDASTNTILGVAQIGRATTGTAANGIGGNLQFTAEDTAGTQRTAAYITWKLAAASSASPQGYLSIGSRNASEALAILDSGNVGIGTVSPENILTLIKNTTAATENTYGLSIQSVNTNAYTELLLGASDAVDAGIIQTAAKNTNFTAKNLSLQPQGGNVLIGTTTSAGYKLDVNGTGRFSGALGISFASGTGSTINLTNTSSASNSNVIETQYNIYDGAVGLSLVASSGVLNPNIGNVNGAFYWKTKFNGSALTTRLYIDQSGNVGIGTSSPSEKLHLYNNTAATATSLIIENNVNNYNCQINFKSIYGGSTAKSFLIGSNISVAAGSWEIYDATASAARLVITSAGNVGIGTASPSYKFTVLQAVADWASKFSNSNGTESVDVFIAYGAGNGIAIDSTENDSTYIFKAMAGTGNGGGKGSVPILYAQCNGNVGLGTDSPSYRLQLSTDSAGKPNGGSWANSSDIRLKENVKTIDNALDKIMQLRGVTFDWKDETEQDNIKSSSGFIADEVMLAFPNWVKELNASDKQKELINDNKVKSLSLPFEFDALLVEAIKELQAQITELKNK